jgi:hypothetical protein
LSIEPQLHAKTVGTQQLVKKSVPRPRVSQRRRKGWKNNNNNNKKGISLCQKIWHSLINNKKREVPFLLPGIPQLLGNRIFNFLSKFIHFRVNFVDFGSQRMEFAGPVLLFLDRANVVIRLHLKEKTVQDVAQFPPNVHT